MRCSVTSAIPVGLRSRVPAKMTSSMRAPRNDFADCSPSTQAMASEMLDFPQPLGPTMAAMPSPWNFSSVRSQKDLKPRIWTFLSLSKFNSLRACARWQSIRAHPKGSPSRPVARASAPRIWPRPTPRPRTATKRRTQTRFSPVPPPRRSTDSMRLKRDCRSFTPADRNNPRPIG